MCYWGNTVDGTDTELRVSTGSLPRIKKKLYPAAPAGLQPATFRSRVRRSTAELSVLPISQKTACVLIDGTKLYVKTLLPFEFEFVSSWRIVKLSATKCNHDKFSRQMYMTLSCPYIQNMYGRKINQG